MKILRSSCNWFVILLTAGCFVTEIRGATVGVNGYTNDFSTLPAVTDWSMLDLTGANSDVTTAVAMDAAIATITAATVNTVLNSDSASPPTANGLGNWSSLGFVYTRPTGNKASIIMVTLTNGINSDAGTVNLSFDFTRANIGAEDDAAFNGFRAYYSLNGSANSWTNIPEFSVTDAAFTSGRLSTTLNIIWPSNSLLYVVWADDNGVPSSPDTTLEIDNFFASAISATPIPEMITNQPQSTIVNEYSPASFTVGAAGFPRPDYQWFKDNVLIPGATNATYTIASTPFSYNNSHFKVRVSNTANGNDYLEFSTDAILTVLPDTNAPTVTGVTGTTNQVIVTFSEPISLASATNLNNYTLIGGGTISSAILSGSSNLVQLNTSLLIGNQTYQLSVSGIQDRSGNTMTLTNVNFTVVDLVLADIGSPSILGTNIPAAGGFDLTAGGSDIGAAGTDQFSFEYVQRAGDFDVKVRLAGMTLSDAWAKAGLMARADLTSGSLYAASLATPANSGCFFQSRSAAGQAAVFGGSSFPVTFPSTWLRLQRVGNVFTGYAGVDGNAWSQLGTVTLALPQIVYLGVAATSRNVSQPIVVQVRDFLSVAGATTASLKLTREPIGPSSRKTGLAITEIMYHPRKIPGFANSLEFIEIYNSQAFFEKIGGYQISGSVDYTFPSNTVMQAGSYLVVARDPDFVKSHYGISNVLGPWDGADTNNLPNDTGTVRLRNRQGAVLLEINYEGNNPWPIAADGAGHSLVLARPSLGEGDPRAWAASDTLDGSPGRDDPYNTDPMRSIVINEILAHTEDPLVEDYIELYNHSTQPVDLSGAFLSDDASTNKFRIPNGTTISATGFVAFVQSTLGFALQANGERVFLVNSNQNRVIDVIDFGAQANGVSSGRSPDGAPTFRELSSRTPGAPNSRPLLRDIVINELMHTPISGNSDDEYVELYNKGTNTVNMGNWKFTAGISFTFPSNTFLAPDGYLVVAKNKTNLLTHYPGVLNMTNTVGDYGGTLAGGGERVALSMPEPLAGTNDLGAMVTNTINVVENEVTYGKGGRWGTWNSGGGSSLELIDPRSDNRQTANWADSDETAKSQWINFEWTGALGQSLGTPINDNLQVFLLGIGECLVDEVELHNGAGANLIANNGFEQGTNSWVFQGSHDFSTIESTGYAGGQSLHLRAASRGDNGANRIRTATLGTSAAGSVTLRAKARWLRGWPEVILRIHGGTAEVVGVMPTPLNLGTPGTRNSQAVVNAGPAIWEVQHSPVMPAATEPVVVTARAYDPDGPISVTLRYRVDAGQTAGISPGLFSSLPMLDNGTGGDAVAGDGIYSATIPGQAAAVTVGFYVQAVDALNATNLFPQDIFPKAPLDRCFPNDALARECVLRWGDVQMPGSFATYHLWLTTANSNRWAYRGHATTADGGLNNAEMDGTFVYNTSRAVYNALPLYAGSPWHRGQMTTGPCGVNRVDYVMNFPGDDRMLGTTDFVLNNPGNPGGTTTSDTSAQSEQTSYIIFNEIGLVYNHRRYIHYFINGSQRSTTSDRTGNFIFEDSQQPDGDMVAEWYPNDQNGELYKIEDWFEFNDNGFDFSSNNDADLLRRTVLVNGQQTQVITPYRFMFRKRSVGPGDFTTNYANFFTLVNAVSPTSDYSESATSNTNPIPDVTAFGAIANYEQWMRIFAVQHTVGNWDSYGFQRGKNDYTYKGQNGLFEQLTWDIDFTMGVGGQSASDDLFSPTISDPRVKGMLATPLLTRAYWRAYQDIVSGPLNAPFMYPILDAKAAAMTLNNIGAMNPATVATIKSYVTNRQSFIQLQLNGVATPFTAGTNSFVSTAVNLYVLSGTAPVNIKDVTVGFNNVEYPVVFTGVKTWTVNLVLNPGTNQLVFHTYDRLGNEIRANKTTNLVNYTGPAILPQSALVINEIMYNSIVTNASYVELYNNSDLSFDLSAWRLDGVDYTFPIGTVIPGRGFLVLAQDRAAIALAAYNGSNAVPVFAEYPGVLDPRGQTLALIKPGATQVDDTVISKVRYEAGAPWPDGANGQGSALQLIDPAADASRAGNWSDSLGWHFASLTGNFQNGTNVDIFMQAAGEVYIDDITLVPAGGPYAGINVVTNGDFESPLSVGPWFIPAAMSNTARTNSISHSGNYSLHVVATSGGSVILGTVIKTPVPNVGSNICTLSFWYHTINSTNFFVRTFPGSSINSASGFSPRPVGATPSLTNSTLLSGAPFPTIWLNEVQVRNTSGPTDSFGEHDPWIELYNSGANVVALDTYYLANNYTNSSQWLFPTGAVINPGTFVLIWADGQTNQTTVNEWHTNFRLTNSTGSIALTRVPAGLPQVIDYLNYSSLGDNQSYGDFPDGQPFSRQTFYSTPTPRTNNFAPPVNVAINEWVASNQAGPGGYPDPADGKYDDWIELYNPGPLPADISGYYLTDTTANKLQWRVPEGTIIPPGGYRLVWADNDLNENGTGNNGDLHANFNLNKGGEAIGLYAVRGTNVIQIDYVTFGAQTTDLSQGRSPDGSANILFLSAPTPRTSNAAPGHNPPVVSSPGNQTIVLGQGLSLPITASDPDSGQILTYSLLAGFPAGASINANSGLFQWTPNGGQAPSTNVISVKVTDNDTPNLSATNSFTVVVTGGGNHAPTLSGIADRTVYLGATVSFTASANDPDAGQTLSYSLLAGFPSGASINASSGLFQWTPNAGQAPSSNPITVQVADNGTPVMNDSKGFTITVVLPPRATINRSGGAISITFPTITGKNYKVQFTSALNPPNWMDLGTSFTAGAGGTSIIPDPDSTALHAQRFYRIVPLD